MNWVGRVSFVVQRLYGMLNMPERQSIQNATCIECNFHFENVKITPFGEQHVDTWCFAYSLYFWPQALYTYVLHVHISILRVRKCGRNDDNFLRDARRPMPRQLVSLLIWFA